MSNYYDSCAIPKPKTVKKKKKQNGYKNKPQRICYYTEQPGAERHEIFGGASRQTSIDMGFQVDVCPEIHARLHAKADKWAQQEINRWQIYYQVKYMEKLINTGLTYEQAMECWRHLIGENFLWKPT